MNNKVFSFARSIFKDAFSGGHKHEMINVEAENDKNKKKVKELKSRLTESQIEMQRTHAEFSLFQNEWRQVDRDKAGTSGSFIKGHPLVSIIIVSRDGLANLKVLMKSFVDKTFYSNFEIIFVDNGSTDGSVAYMKEFGDRFAIRIIENGENKSFSEANNIGVAQAKGDYYLFLNNDIELTDGWLDELIHACQKHDRAGAVGARLFYPDIPRNLKKAKRSFAIQHAGVIFKEVVREDQYFIQPYNRRNCEPDRDHLAADEHLAAVTAATLLVEADKFHQVGGFDQQYIYGYEDVDLCLKLDEAGFRNIYCPHCILFHYEFGTQQQDNKEEVYQRRLRNFKIFRARWQDYLAARLAEDKKKGRHVYTDQPFLVTLLSGTAPSRQEREVLEKKMDPVWKAEFRTYEEYESLAADDMETDLLIDPAGIYKDVPHRKTGRQVFSSLAQAVLPS